MDDFGQDPAGGQAQRQPIPAAFANEAAGTDEFM